jgi:subfamily B ATP-binding cassette protein MsbA
MIHRGNFDGSGDLTAMKTSSRLLRYIVPYSGSIVVATIFAILIALCEIAYIRTLAETIDAVKVIETNGLPTSVSFLRRPALPGSAPSYFWIAHLADANAAIRMISIVAVAILAAFLLKGILSFGRRYIMARVSQKLILNLRNELYDNLVHFPLGFFTKSRAGDIMSRGTNDMGILYNSVQSLAAVVQAGAIVVVSLVMMLLISWQLTLLAVVVFPPAIYVINQFGRRIKDASGRIQAKVANISSYLERTVSGIKIIKSFATEDWERTQFTKENKGRYSIAMKRERLGAYLFPIIELMSAAGMVAVLWFGLWQVITGKLTVGWFIGFIGLVGAVYRPVKTLGTFNASFQQAVASAERIFEILDVEPEFHDATDAVPISTINGDVEFRDVSFTYDGERVVLRHIDLKVNAGESIALVGPSGVGKTTLVSLLTRFYEVTDGEIAIDGHPISKITLRSLRQQVGLVPQETVIFGGTVRENVAYGQFDANEDEIIQAARGANAHEFIMQLPDGYDTHIGERGMQLSGGQRQRLAIARAILKDPRILILDEATSSLDTESEALIQEALANLMKGRTTFVIAHRLSTVVSADKIIVLNNGEIVESGTHSQLIAQDGLYRKLCDAQFRYTESE